MLGYMSQKIEIKSLSAQFELIQRKYQKKSYETLYINESKYFGILNAKIILPL